MITIAIILLTLIILLATISFGSLILVLVSIIKSRKKLQALSLTIFLASICLLSATVIYTGVKTVNRAYITAQTLSDKGKARFTNFIDPGPDIIFTGFTELEWPENVTAKVIATGDEYWLFEWEHYLVFETDQAALEMWLESPPPWDVEEWTRGPVPPHINYFTKDYLSVEFVNSENVWYVAKEYCCDTIEFHSGDVVILDFETNRVWLASWDY